MPRKRLPEFYLEILKALPKEKNSIDESQIVWDTLHRNITPRCKLQQHGESPHLQRCFMHEMLGRLNCCCKNCC